eukprot:TRINITY_DN462_c0_g1_i1.p1 TRINITY_DN462_c0_g1~~TRINITY_DN462_c0_g1_i1.p1  ORF type:complete len:241 (-),score=54.37 TRINITY_DN462_c0_g1_i1:82-804(-)
MAEAHCDNCVKGGNQDGKGKVEKYGNVDAFIVRPTSSAKAALVISTDIFGATLRQVQEIAETLGKAGFLVVVPDLFAGDPYPANSDFSGIGAWMAKHPVSKTAPIVADTVKYVKDHENVQKLGVIGYCYGGKISIKQASNDLVDVFICAHPATPDAGDVEAIKKPGFFICAEVDDTFGKAVRENTEAVLKKNGIRAEFKLYPGTRHGFAVRGDDAFLNTPEQKGIALDDTIKFLVNELHP